MTSKKPKVIFKVEKNEKWEAKKEKKKKEEELKKLNRSLFNDVLDVEMQINKICQTHIPKYHQHTIDDVINKLFSPFSFDFVNNKSNNVNISVSDIHKCNLSSNSQYFLRRKYKLKEENSETTINSSMEVTPQYLNESEFKMYLLNGLEELEKIVEKTEKKIICKDLI